MEFKCSSCGQKYDSKMLPESQSVTQCPYCGKTQQFFTGKRQPQATGPKTIMRIINLIIILLAIGGSALFRLCEN